MVSAIRTTGSRAAMHPPTPWTIPPTAMPELAARPAAIPQENRTRDIQRSLKNAGFYAGAIDGKMGPLTREAVKEFQRVHGLTDDGIVGKKTWAKLSQYATLSSSEPSAAEILK
jgi:peptidoglycan hydrolase-like protein with peptidoglycan-binding domain